jgi:hypothetical protein
MYVKEHSARCNKQSNLNDFPNASVYRMCYPDLLPRVKVQTKTRKDKQIRVTAKIKPEKKMYTSIQLLERKLAICDMKGNKQTNKRDRP